MVWRFNHPRKTTGRQQSTVERNNRCREGNCNHTGINASTVVASNARLHLSVDCSIYQLISVNDGAPLTPTPQAMGSATCLTSRSTYNSTSTPGPSSLQQVGSSIPEVIFECRLCSCSSSTTVVQLSQASPEKKDTKTQLVSIIMLAAEIIMKTAIGPQVPPADCCDAYRGRCPPQWCCASP